MLELYLVRHGQVDNPTGIIYGHLPGFGLSDTGRTQIKEAARVLANHGPYQALYASPLQRTQESAALLGIHLNLEIQTEDLLVETAIGNFQGKYFKDLPQPYITEEKIHKEIEAAKSMRDRLLRWTTHMLTTYPNQRLIAVSHRDPLIVALLYWMGKGLEHLPKFPLDPGTVYSVHLESPHKGHVKRLTPSL